MIMLSTDNTTVQRLSTRKHREMVIMYHFNCAVTRNFIMFGRPMRTVGTYVLNGTMRNKPRVPLLILFFINHFIYTRRRLRERVAGLLGFYPSVSHEHCITMSLRHLLIRLDGFRQPYRYLRLHDTVQRLTVNYEGMTLRELQNRCPYDSPVN